MCLSLEHFTSNFITKCTNKSEDALEISIPNEVYLNVNLLILVVNMSFVKAFYK